MTKDKINAQTNDFKVICALLMCIMPYENAEHITLTLLKKYKTLSNILSQPCEEILATALGIEEDIKPLLQLIYESARRVHFEG